MGQKIVYRGNDTLFYNSQCLFVEYHDVIAMPWLTMLAFTKNTEIFDELFNIYEISDYNIKDLFEWYVYRKHRNVFKSIGVRENVEEPSDEGYSTLLEKAMSISNDIYKIPTNLKFLSILRILLTDASMIKQVIIYSEQNEPMIENTLSRYFTNLGSKVKYMNGKFEDMLKVIPPDSTYVLSDIEKVNDIIKANKLNLSSILIANGLRYNYMEDDQTKLKVDLDELSTKYIFKYSFFDNFDLSDALSDELLASEINSNNNG